MVKTYSPKDVILIVGGMPITGYSDGTFIKVTRESDSFIKVVGADGDVSRTKSADKSGSIEITLKQTSLSNDYLSSLAITDELTGKGVVPVLIKDNKGTTIVEVAEAWIKKPADIEFGKDLSDRSWTIDCASIDEIVGGNL